MPRAPFHDTIIAPITALHPAPVAALRLSGPQSGTILRALTQKPLPAPREAALSSLHDSQGLIDKALLLWFPAPHSFTGEDVAEIQMHGALPLVHRLLNAAFVAGARMALPGEFSRRALENGKMNLAQAEGLMALIAAQSKAEAEAAMRVYQGKFSSEVYALIDALQDLRAHVEAHIDFDEMEAPVDFDSLLSKTRALVHALKALLARGADGARLRHLPKVVLLGAPNAGKSSLFNALLGESRAISHETAGTTRDLNEALCDSLAVRLSLLDTAGLREGVDNPVEKEGIKRAKDAAESADLVVFVYDAAESTPPDAQAYPQSLLVANKIDLLPSSAREACKGIPVSAKTAEGLEALKTTISERFQSNTRLNDSLLLSSRADSELQSVNTYLQRALSALENHQIDLAAFDFMGANQVLRRFLGEFDGDEAACEAVYDAVFSKFCIGK